MKNNTLRTVVIVFVAVILVVGAFGGGVVTGSAINLLKPGSTISLPLTNGISAQPTTTSPSQGGTPADLQSLFGPFWQAWDLVHQNYVDQPVDNTKLVQGAISGMMAALGDAHTGYSTPQEATDLNNALAGSYDGIGAYVDTKGTYITITKTIPGYPAEKAGLLTGDQIIAVDGVDVTGMDPDVVRLTKVLGQAGTSVTLTISRTGVDKPLEVTLTRAHIVIPSVTSKMLDHNLGYIQIADFGATTADDFHKQLSALIAQKPSGIVLDLRDNGGGYLDAAIAVASEFIDHGVIVSEQYGDGTKTPHPAISGGLATSIPLVVLVNGNTASASEIVSGAIQDDGRGKLLGVTTYGKGTVQNYFPLSDGGLARITIARWLTPNGNTIDKKGLTPDLVVTMTQADYTAGKDPQLDAAVQLLLTP
jgi:carboxyl-terminal processing protease